MNQKIYQYAILTIVATIYIFNLNAQTATIIVNSDIKHQKITGFGGFVNSPQFGYNHMTTAQIRQLWGSESVTGYNLMRLFIPTGESNWQQVIATAQLAQSLGIKIFASPWSMPAAWKTNNHINGTYNGVVGYLKEEHYEDYANYLNNFVKLLRNNGVELTAISIQNEPDYSPEYAGCRWTPQQMANFIRDYGHLITAPIMAAEGVGITDNYANAMLPDEVFNNLSIFAGHQYGAIQSAHKKLQEKGMEVWMSEFLINWNANLTTARNFSWSIDAFDFAKAVNTALLADINAWVHYASRRYYGMMGDGTNGIPNGVITKRGYILSHFAKYTIGTTRVSHSWKDTPGVLDGSAYITESGDSVIVKVINPSNNVISLNVDLPFLTQWGKGITTTSSANMAESAIEISHETFRPKVQIAASSFTTLIFRKSGERPISEMTGEPVYFNKIETQTVTNPAFGSTYQLSGSTRVFDNSRSLISNFTSAANGYLKLNDRYTRLVFNIKSISSPGTYTSSNTTLHYINDNGQVRSYNYGTLTFNPNGSSVWVLDISRNVIADGVAGIIRITNGNWTSILTIIFGDVYFLMGNEKVYKFSGPYSEWDGNLLDCLEDPNHTSIDFTNTTGITPAMNWKSLAANPNNVFFVSKGVANNNPNVIRDGESHELVLSEHGNFYIPEKFTAQSVSYTRNFEGYGLMVLPFQAQIPNGEIKVYDLQYASEQVFGTRIQDGIIPSNTPVLVVGTGTFTFTGTGEISTPPLLTVKNMNGVYVTVKAPANSYSLKIVDGIGSFHRVTAGAEPAILPFTAYLDLGNAVMAQRLPIELNDVTNIDPVIIEQIKTNGNNTIFDLWGRPVLYPQRGVIYIIDGKKVIYQSN